MRNSCSRRQAADPYGAGLQVGIDRQQYALQDGRDLLGTVVLEPHGHHAGARFSAAGQQGGVIEVLRDHCPPLYPALRKNETVRGAMF
jgi:hypothetical protein